MPQNDTSEIIERVRDTVYRGALLLDDEKWDEFLDFCDDSFQYNIRAFSPEINYDMTYFSGNLKDLKSMTKSLPKHNTDHSGLKRHVTVYTVDTEDKGKTATATSSFLIYQNMLDGINSHIDAGENRLFMVGRYNDKFLIKNDVAKFVEREVRLETRRLDKGSHYLI
jgi:methanesulfonate monooxygenase small subunit